MSTAPPVVEYSAGQYCSRCQVLFSEPDSFHRLAESDEGYMHYDADELEASCQRGCPFCQRLAEGGTIEIMRARKARHLVLDIGSWSFSGDPADFRPGHVDCLRLWYRYPNDRLGFATWVKICAPIGDPAAREILNRPRQKDPTSDSFYQTVQGWLHDCLHKHEDCVGELSSDLPTRVLDVGDNEAPTTLRLHHNSGSERGQYVALSYCWGKAQSVVTTSQNVGEHLRNLSFDALHQTVRDAVTVTCRLKFQYLWIDALCILQDDLQDKVKEIRSMENIYKKAHLTIVAQRASNVDEGFLGPCLSRKHETGQWDVRYRFPYHCRDGRMGEVWLDRTISGRLPQPLNYRGWAMQEGVLAPRALHFEPWCVEWQCFRSGHRHKGVLSRELLTVDDETQGSHSAVRSESRMQAAARSDIWETLVEDYSGRNLSIPEDKFLAVEGLARQLNRTWGDTYLAGIWQSNVIRQLLWHFVPYRRLDAFDSQFAVVEARPRRYRAPSWSWASFDGHVFFLVGTCYSFIPKADYVGATITPVFPKSPMGQIRDAEISISAAAIPCRDMGLADPTWDWKWMLDDGSKELDDGSKELDESQLSAATLVFLGYIVYYASGNSDDNLLNREATGLVLLPAGNNTFQRIGKFQIRQPTVRGGFEQDFVLFPGKSGVTGSEDNRQIFRII